MLSEDRLKFLEQIVTQCDEFLVGGKRHDALIVPPPHRVRIIFEILVAFEQ